MHYRTRPSKFVVLSVALVVGGLAMPCNAGDPGEIHQVTPGTASTDDETRVTLSGRGFPSSAAVSLLPGGMFESAFLPTPSVAERIAIHDHFALVTAWNQCVTVFDIGDPLDPSEVGSWHRPGGCFDVKTEANYAYASSKTRDTFFVLDLDEPRDPQLVQEVDTGLRDGKVAIHAGRLYVGGAGDYGAGRIRIYSLDDPEDPQFLADHLVGSTIYDLVPRGTLLYAVIRDTLLILDPSQPDDIREVSRLPLRGSRALHLSGNLAYITRRTDGLAVVDVTNPALPSIVVEYAPDNLLALDVIVADDVAHVSGGPGLTLLDVRDPSAPEWISDIPVPSGGRALELVEDFAFLVAGGLVVVGFADPVGPDFYLAGIPIASDDTYDIAIREDYAYAVARRTGLLTIDIRNPADPWIVSLDEEPRRPSAVMWEGRRLYTSGWYLGVFNLRRASAPDLLGAEGAYTGAELTVGGNHAYVVNHQLGLGVYDISDPSDPRLIASRAGLGIANDVDLSGDVLFVAGGSDGLYVLDVSTPRFPSVVSHRTTSDIARGVVAVDTHLLVADYRGGVLTYDVSNPAAPDLVNVYETRGKAEHLVVRGSTAYVSDWSNGILQFDVSNPARPVLKGAYGRACRGSSIDATDTHVFGMGPELNVCTLNPFVADVSVPSTEEIEFTVPPGFASGFYHVLVTDRQTGDTAILYNSLRVAPAGPLAILPIE